MRSGNKTKINRKIITAANVALAISVLLHGAVFSAAFIASGGGLKNKGNAEKKRNALYPVSLMLLPDVEKRGEKSRLKEKNSTDTAAEDKEEFGMAAARVRQKGADIESEMLTYRDMIKRRLQENRRYPYAAKWKSLEGTVGLYFVIGKEGGVKDIKVTESSGAPMLDSEAAETVKRSSPFPRVPEEFGMNEMQMSVNIVFRLK